MKTITLEQLLEIMAVVAEADGTDCISWRCDGEYAPISFWINCNDLFWWGTADGEDLTYEQLPILKQAIVDCKAIKAYAFWAFTLYCCRVRKMRPQGCCYPGATPEGVKEEYEELARLFDTCGPERLVDMNNPYARGKRSAR